MRLPDPDDIVEIQPLDLTSCFPLSALREPETTFLLRHKGLFPGFLVTISRDESGHSSHPEFQNQGPSKPGFASVFPGKPSPSKPGKLI